MSIDGLSRLLRRLAYLARQRRHDRDLRDELEFHRSMMAGRDEREVARAMGNVTLAREDARDVWLGHALQRTWRDAVYGARALRREPTFAATALLALTAGIASATAMFSVVDAELWKALPFSQPHHLVAAHAAKDGRYRDLTLADLRAWRDRSRLAHYTAMASSARRVLRHGTAESVTTRPITIDFLDMLGVRPSLGRGFGPADEHGPEATILSDTGWTRLFQRDPGAVGRTVSIDDVAYTIVGITGGTRFEFTRDPDFFVVLGTDEAGVLTRASRPNEVNIYGRLRDGVAIGEAQAELRSFATERDDRVVSLDDLQRYTSGFNWRTLYFFLGAAGILLLLSGLNVAGLLLARALRRRREFAIRGALGGGLGSLVRQLVVEGALLAVPASAAGLLAAGWLLRALSVSIPADHLSRGGYLEVDLRAAAFVLAICGLTTIGLAVTPLFFARRIDLNVSLAAGGRSAGPSRQHMRVRGFLLTAQVSATVVLLGAAALFAFSFLRATGAPLGFEPADRLALRVALSGGRYASDASIAGFADRLLEQALATGGIRSVAVGSASPLDGNGMAVQVVVADQPRPAQGQEPTALVRTVGPDYFRTLGINLVAGREITATDVSGAPRVAVVNELLARRLFPGQSAIGRPLDIIPRVRTGWASRAGVVVIVGVVADVRNFMVNEVAFNTVHLAFAQAPAPGFELLAHTAVPPSDLMPRLRAAVSRVDPAIPVMSATTLPDRVDTVLRSDRFNLMVVAFFATAATLLAAIGIYGAMARAVEERAREFGIRIALGAGPRRVIVAALSSTLRIAAVGGVAGIGLAVVIARLLGDALYLVPGRHGGLLYGVKTTDPLALGLAAAVLMIVGLAAGLIPARRAVRIDPAIALRSE